MVLRLRFCTFGLFSAAIGLFLATAAAAADLKPLATGTVAEFKAAEAPKEAAAIAFQDGAGKALDLGAFRGKVVLLNLWATWCAPCITEMPALDRLQGVLGGKDFEVLALSLDRVGAEKAKAFLDRIGIRNLSFYIDATMKAGRALGAQGLPVSILIDRQGRELGRLTGPAEWDAPEAQALIKAAIAAQ